MDMADDKAAWPKKVREMYDYAARAGFSPQVTGVPGGDWEVFVEGSRIRASAFYSHRNGRTRQTGSRLTVDGELHRSAHDMNDLRQIWDKYENGAPPPALAEIEDPGETPVPRGIQEAVELVRKRLGDQGEVRAGLSGSDWVIGIGLPGTADGMRIFAVNVHGDWKVDMSRLQLVIDGEDRSHEAGGDLTKALTLLSGASTPEAAAPPSSPFRKSPAKRDTGVEMRKGNVIRV